MWYTSSITFPQSLNLPSRIRIIEPTYQEHFITCICADYSGRSEKGNGRTKWKKLVSFRSPSNVVSAGSFKRKAGNRLSVVRSVLPNTAKALYALYGLLQCLYLLLEPFIPSITHLSSCLFPQRSSFHLPSASIHSPVVLWHSVAARATKRRSRLPSLVTFPVIIIVKRLISSPQYKTRFLPLQSHNIRIKLHHQTFNIYEIQTLFQREF